MYKNQIRAYLYDQNKNRHGTLPTLETKVVLRNSSVSSIDIRVDGNNRYFTEKEPYFKGGHLLVTLAGEQLIGAEITRITREHSGGLDDYTLTGESHLKYAAGRFTIPTPTRAINLQDQDAHYKDSGLAGDVIRRLFHSHCGAGVPAVNIPTPLVAPVLGVRDKGKTVRLTSRFQNVLEEAQKLADTGGLIFWTELASDVTPTLVVDAPRDKSREIRFRHSNATITKSTVTEYQPTAGLVAVAGQGEKQARTIIVENAGTVQGWSNYDWIFQDARDTDDRTELIQRAQQTLLEHVETANVTLEINPPPGLVYGKDYRVGDVVTAQIAPGLNIAETLQELTITDSVAGLGMQAVIGPHREPLEDDQTPGFLRKLRATQQLAQ